MRCHQIHGTVVVEVSGSNGVREIACQLSKHHRSEGPVGEPQQDTNVSRSAVDHSNVQQAVAVEIFDRKRPWVFPNGRLGAGGKRPIPLVVENL